jgi:hypothetical protein
MWMCSSAFGRPEMKAVRSVMSSSVRPQEWEELLSGGQDLTPLV